MYSRVTLLEVDTMRVSMEDALAVFQEEVHPRLAELEGYEGVLVLTTAEGKGMLVSFWESEAAADASASFAGGELERLVTLFRSPPGREHYEVVFAELPDVLATAR
jgi:hypothetical protein